MMRKWIALILSTSLGSLTAKDVTAAVVGKVSEPLKGSSESVRYDFTEGSKIEFTGRKILGSHEGGFKEFSGHFMIEGESPTSGAFTIDLNSMWSDNDKLTAKLKSADFFEVKTYQEARFTVTEFERKSDNHYTVSGDLSLHGQEKNISFPAKVTHDGGEVKLSSAFTIDRHLWKITSPGVKDKAINAAVEIRFDLIAKKKADLY